MNEPDRARHARSLRGIWLGRRPYLPVYALQRRLLEARKAGGVGDTVLFVEHDPVITLGRGAHGSNLRVSPEALRNLGVDLTRTDRGGDITLHAPGQLVAYPILDLSPDHKDVRRYVRLLSEVMRRITLDSGVDGGNVDDWVGLWVDPTQPSLWPGQESARALAKVGAIGVRLSRWVTMHGFALNLSTDLTLFDLIVPCGITEHGVTSIQALTGKTPALLDASQIALRSLATELGCVALPLEHAVDLELESLGP